jgi:CubicO group peptidase (beta-lactamase class C family)
MDTTISSSAIFIQEDLDALFSEWDVPGSPGCALGIIHRSELIYARGYGWADLEHDVPITSCSVFDLASTSKQFTAMCIALLSEAGILSLDDDIHKYLPELPDLGAQATIRHLIHHTSGWRDYLELMALKGMGDEDYYTDEDVLEILACQKSLNFKPGEDFLYSNTGYFLLGIIVQRASGLSLRRFAEENIFKPLGMANTHFHDDHTEIVRRRAIGYAPREQGGYSISMTPLDMVGDGSLLSSVEDLFLWDQNFYQNKLGKGSADLLDLMHTPGVKNDGEALDYAFGLEVKDYKGLRMVSHSGAFMGYRSELLRFPENHFSVICLANLNSINPSKLASCVADLCLAALLGEPAVSVADKSEQPVAVAENELVDKAGFYWNAAVDLILEISVETGNLLVEGGGKRIEFEALREDHFRSQDTPFDVELQFKHQLDWELILTTEAEAPIRLTRFEPPAITPERLAEYTGRYYSLELDTTYRVEMKDGLLYLKYRNAPHSALKLAFSDVFWVGELVLYFSRTGMNGNLGTISGFTVNAGRVKGISFQRMN